MKKRLLAIVWILCLLPLRALAAAAPGELVEAPPAAAEPGKLTQAPQEFQETQEQEAQEAEKAPISYSDVAGDEWFAQAALDLSERGIMTGVEEGLFAPYQEVTRATVILVLWRLEGSPDAAVAEPFPDVEPWFATAAAWAKGMGIASGYNTGYFMGRDPVTREQLAQFFYRYAQYKGDDLALGVLTRFRDADAISDWARPAVAHAVGVGLLRGGDYDTLDPKGTANRAALVVMLERLATPVAG